MEMKIWKKSILILICISLLLMCGCSSKKDKTNILGGYVSMKAALEKAKGPDEVYEAIQAILDEGKSLDLSNTQIEISKTLILHNQNIYGGKITYTGNDGEPVIKMSGKCIVDSVIIENSCTSVDCGEGKYVGIWLSNEKGTVTNGSVIRSVRFKKCGTMIYAPADVEAAAKGMIVENLRGEGWFFRGIDFQSPKCSNNSFCNLYLNLDYFAGTTKDSIDVAPPADSAFYLDGSVSTVIRQLNVEHTSIKEPIVFKNCSDLQVSTIHVEGVNIATDGKGYLNFTNTSGRIGAVDFYWTHVYSKNNSLIVLDESSKEGNELKFETMVIKGINDPVTQIEGINRGMDKCGMKLFGRDDKYTNPYFVTIENYVYFTYQNDKEILESFVADKDNITFKKIGQLPAGGTTEERPTQRLCAGYTEYFDITVGKLLVWNGNAWE